ncbi:MULTISPECIES: 2-oxo acid dehydrogenase subunit E2 [unclassified Rhizobium]|uniref:2-oxo acid dehydrogenase subunit E2 n=1 Tax=unclassified Rhizobium TaxID=2613769 RepID=UPI0021F6B295|nr:MULTISPECIES: 2-oxo acid dehydrogenase subunit E2 [unclassified Rhizobium]MCV9941859.1 2-oxo acid dehydrogenase subunit E2 [Rhizobium sp. BT-175]MCW0016164.1 2-oxo acid dehydrogenase subunit E2 [Rhizobium sp. BT-226]
MRGRTIKLSASRRLVGDLMRFSIGVPRVTVQRQMNLRPLLDARDGTDARPSWTVLFLKGYALLSQEIPELRRAYIKFPRPQLYEYPASVASIAHEREHEGERVVLLSIIKGPEQRSISQLETLIRAARSLPVLEIKEFRRSLKLARAPAPVRWLLMWLGLNIGRKRARYFGTFQLSVYSGLGAESLNPLTPLTTLLNYGPIDEDGSVAVRIHYDHRVMDGANVARALERFERILNCEIADEVRNLAQSGIPAIMSAAGTSK